ncbi:MAG: ornithine carbamoyltransferase [Omnitrophica WOR_2 bacterium RIFCSPHIGHO2_02_FULL_48_11]|nr:MAG: ornithine carbamoyltransferase [Omnitrophica WOR_2 bacterium RIFCSPHIGHO2_02_FULL_48_11]
MYNIRKTKLMKRDFPSIQSLSNKELESLLTLTKTLKTNRKKYGQDLKGKTIGLVFQKPSNRTRVSFEVAIWQLGGNCIYLGPDEINLGKRETTHDVAKTLSRYLDAIVARTFTHGDIVELGKHASVPVINGLSDLAHPCQALADVFSIREKFGKQKNITVAYVGDGNNVCHSLMLACVKLGYNIHIASPKGFEPKDSVVQLTQKSAHATGAKILITNSPQEAVQGAQVIYSDVFISMGEETQGAAKANQFTGFQVNSGLAKLADKNYIYMHCLPAHRGEEVTADIIDGPHSIVFDQAENRLHVQKAVLLFLLNKK